MQPYPNQGWGQSPYPPPPPPKKQPGALAAIGAIAAMCVVCSVIGRFSPPPAPAPPASTTQQPAALVPAAPSAPEPTGAPTAAPPAAPAPAADTRQFVNSTCAQVAELFGPRSRLSEIQRDALWGTSYNDRWVRWPVRVVEVSSTFGQLQLQFKCPRSRSFTYDGIAAFGDPSRDQLMRIGRGDTVTLVARLTDHGEVLGLSLAEGELE